MPLWDRIVRLFEGDATSALMSERVWAGLVGEEHATTIIQQTQPLFHRANVIVPFEDGSDRFQETDHIVLWGGTVFVVEFKNYKGLLEWADAHKSALVQYKTGNYGETLPPKPASNPRTQATRFIRGLKGYLSRHADARFEKLRFQPVGAFTRAADLTPIYDGAQGLIYIDELPAYFAAQQDPRFAQRPSAWVRHGLEQLPSLDVVVDSRGQTHRGLLAGTGLQYQTANGTWYEGAWQDLACVEVQLATGFFSEQDDLVLHGRAGGGWRTKFRRGSVGLRTLEGDRHDMPLRGLWQIVPAPVRFHADPAPQKRMLAAPTINCSGDVRRNIR